MAFQSVEQAAVPGRAAAFLSAQELTMTQALQQATLALREAGIDTPRLDAEVLLAHTLGVYRARLLARLHEPLPEVSQQAFAHLVARRLHHEPIAYLVGHKEFYGLDFVVDRRVLIPRPETECLVQRAIAVGRALLATRHAPLVLADVGTGCGCIAVSLAVHLPFGERLLTGSGGGCGLETGSNNKEALAVHPPQARIYATESSSQALEVARDNVRRHSVGDRVHLLGGDLLSPIPLEICLDLIVANLPYIPQSQLETLPPSVRYYEPLETALNGGTDGLGAIRRLLEEAPHRLRPGGAVLLEIGATQGSAVAELARKRFPAARVRILLDLAGRDRVVEIRTLA